MSPPPPSTNPRPQKDHYTTLNLTAYRPSSLSQLPPGLPPAVLKKAYRETLLRTHPDKTSSSTSTSSPSPSPSQAQPPNDAASRQQQQQDESTTTTTTTIDAIKLAYATLSSPSKKHAYDTLLLSSASSPTTTPNLNVDETFLSGLDVLDLADFAADQRSGYVGLPGSPTERSEEEGDEVGEGGSVEWTAPCHRCATDPGFVVSEAELEKAEQRGEGEVLVGCRGCSLWVRVEFGVVEG